MLPLGSVGVLPPADHDLPPDTGYRQRRRFRCHRIAFGVGEAAPGLDRHRVLGTPRRDVSTPNASCGPVS